MQKPNLSTAQIWNMSLGFLGIQMGFALQNGNASRMLQSYGADVEHLSWFWLVAPLTGMIVQPIIGHMSDKTWNRLGRRRPYFLVGAILSAIGLLLMPNAGAFTAFLPALWVGAGFLMIMDASFNVAMEPFRALVADKLNTDQRTAGFSIQTVLIGIGAVVGSWLPYVLAEWMGIPKEAAPGQIPQNLIWSFVIGAMGLLGTILWTITHTDEYPPEVHEQFNTEPVETSQHGFIHDLVNMPKTMLQLGLVQFFSWFGLFSMWVFTTSAVASHVYGLPLSDSSSTRFQDAGNWVGIIFGVYNLVSAIYAFFLPSVAKKIGRRQTHAISLLAGALGLISIYFVSDPTLLIISMVGVGIAWASILAMPYAILGGAIPAHKMGVYMGIFNFFITLPQIASSLSGPFLLQSIYGGQPIFAIVGGGVCFIIAALACFLVDDKDETRT